MGKEDLLFASLEFIVETERIVLFSCVILQSKELLSTSVIITLVN